MKVTFFLATTLAMIQPASASEPFRDNAGSVHIQSLTPSQKITIFTDSDVVRKPKANKCGLLTVPLPTGYSAYGENLVIAGTYMNTFSIPTQAAPFCNRVNGIYSLSSPPPGVFKTPEGLIIVANLTPSMQYEILYPGLLNPKTYTANKCGNIKFPAPQSGAFKIADPSTAFYTMTTLPTNLPNLCIRGQRYAPSIP